MPTLLEMRGITKRFPGVLANDGVDFDLKAGEVHTLLGENGAGKSTLMNILYGMHHPDEGEVLLEGTPVEIANPTDAINLGIGMVHQHFMLVPTLTVTENIALGLKSQRRKSANPATSAGNSGAGDSKSGGPNLAFVRNHLLDLSEQHGLKVDPDAYIWQLAVGERQRVEILKALYRQAKILVLDEPTAVLTPQEADDLIAVLKKMASDGRGLVFISHKLHEVMSVSNRITVLRDGRVSGNTTPAETRREDLARMMVGRPVQLVPDKPQAKMGQTLLEVSDLVVANNRGTDAVQSISIEVKSGEIFGLAGVSGNGQRELAQAIAGLQSVKSGKVRISDIDITGKHPSQIRKAGLSYVPEERMIDGVVPEFTVSENLLLLNRRSRKFSILGFLRFGEIKRHCQQLVERFTIKTPGLKEKTSNLSGGNIQKLILARELSSQPKVILAAQPTRGVDIGAAEYIHSQLLEQKAKGTATLLVSEDLDEVLALSDRIGIIYEGRLMDVVNHEDATTEKLGLLMAGVQS